MRRSAPAETAVPHLSRISLACAETVTSFSQHLPPASACSPPCCLPLAPFAIYTPISVRRFIKSSLLSLDALPIAPAVLPFCCLLPSPASLLSSSLSASVAFSYFLDSSSAGCRSVSRLVDASPSPFSFYSCAACTPRQPFTKGAAASSLQRALICM